MNELKELIKRYEEESSVRLSNSKSFYGTASYRAANKTLYHQLIITISDLNKVLAALN